MCIRDRENTAPDVIVKKVSITPEKFKDDVEVLVGYIGEEHFISGLKMCIRDSFSGWNCVA